MIVSHANNHLLTLSEFASDKANYHLKMSSKTLWAKSLHHDSQLYYRGYVTTHIYTQTPTNMHKHGALCSLWTGCRDIIWMLWSDGRLVLLLHPAEIGFQPIRCCFCFIFCSLMLGSFEAIYSTLSTSRERVGVQTAKPERPAMTCWKIREIQTCAALSTLLPPPFFPQQGLNETKCNIAASPA